MMILLCFLLVSVSMVQSKIPLVQEIITLDANNSTKIITNPDYYFTEDHFTDYAVKYKYIIKAPRKFKIRLQCSESDISFPLNCNRNFLRIYRTKYCTSTNIDVNSRGRRLRVLYKNKPPKNTNGYEGSSFKCIATMYHRTNTTTPATTESTTEATTPTTTESITEAMTPTTTESTTEAMTPTTVARTCSCGVKNTVNRIVGGQPTEVNEYPWQALVSPVINGETYICGGSLISDQWVLTAAHCLQGASSASVTLGNHRFNPEDVDDKQVTYQDKSRIIHPFYLSNNTDNDIALIELESSVTFQVEIAPVCLPFPTNSRDIDGEFGTVVGWGTTSSGGSTSNVLLEVDVPFITTEDCRNTNYGNRITDNMICAGVTGKDSCQGDSGGPLFWNPNNGSYQYQVGVVSFGIGCGWPGYPGVYAKVEKYLDWIENVVNATSDTFCKE